jgi:hypothetical protein
METTLQTIKILPENETQRVAFIRKMKAEILNGFTDIPKAFAMLNLMAKMFKEIKDDPELFKALKREADKYPEKTIQFDWGSMTKTNKTVYDYSTDPIWAELESKLKEREAFLKALKSNVVCPDTGLVITPVASKVSESFSFKINK